MRLLLTLAFLALSSITAQAQSNVVGSSGARIVIAPAKTEIARQLKVQLRAAREIGTANARELYYFYGSRGFEPLWLSDTNEGDWRFADRSSGLFALLDNAADWGLDPDAYVLPSADLQSLYAAKAELTITAAALRFGRDNYGGRVEPRSVSPNLDMDRQALDVPSLLTNLATTPDPAQVLSELAPDDPEFRSLLLALKRSDEGVATPPIGDGPSLKPGMTDDRVSAIRQRLGLTAVGATDSTVYDDALAAAIKGFQSRVGLAPDGVIGAATRDALSRAGQVTREQLLVNLEKWRWLPRDRGPYAVEVNIPEYRLWVRRNGDVVHQTRVVVGTPTNQTPIFYDRIRHVVVNPYWNVPSSIIRNEIGPQVRRDPGYLGRRQFELLDGGTVVDPLAVDWAAISSDRFPFTVRQRPGALNALGQVKFLFPNKHDVYLHDTPEKGLFGKDVRAYSHGCVRVENPFEFAAALLADEPSFGPNDLVKSFGPRERWFNMEKTVPVYLTYFTVRADEDGTLRSFSDVYGHDALIAAALRDGAEL